MNWLFPLLTGALTGLLSGFGIGGGTLLVLWLTLAEGFSQLRAGGVNLAYFPCCALPALLGRVKNRLVEKKAALWCALFGIPACICAALLAARLDTTLLRRCFGVLLLFVGWQEVFPQKREGEKGP